MNWRSEDAVERYCVNMYHQTVREIDLAGKDVLEIGCGRGGGADYISRYMKPKTYIGLDLNQQVVKACNKTFDNPGLSFVQGCADDLPFEDEEFDAIVNVESSRCYPDMMGFLHDAKRVLKPGGHLLFSDMRYVTEHEMLQKQFAEVGFKVLVEKDILPNVVKALEIDDERRKKWINERVKSKFGTEEHSRILRYCRIYNDINYLRTEIWVTGIMSSKNPNRAYFFILFLFFLLHKGIYSSRWN